MYQNKILKEKVFSQDKIMKCWILNIKFKSSPNNAIRAEIPNFLRNSQGYLDTDNQSETKVREREGLD